MLEHRNFLQDTCFALQGGNTCSQGNAHALFTYKCHCQPVQFITL